MSEPSSQEPTMEEILASIRRIISEDEAPAEGSGIEIPQSEHVPEPRGSSMSFPDDEPKAAAAAAAPAFEAEPEDEDGDLELTQKVETHGDLDFVEAPEVEAEAGPEPEPDPIVELPPHEPPSTPGALVSDHVAAAAAATFGKLTSNLLVPQTDRTLEDVVRELLRPMLQQWLDENLSGIVQQAVDAEVERIARGRGR